MRLVGISACVPKNVVTPSVAYERFSRFEVDRIVENTGVLRKREAAPGVTATDMCIAAAERLLEGLGWARDSVDALILCTTLPDYVTPASSHRAQHELGLRNDSLVFDITLACSGFTHGAILFHGLIAAGLVFDGRASSDDAAALCFHIEAANGGAVEVIVPYMRRSDTLIAFDDPQISAVQPEIFTDIQ